MGMFCIHFVQKLKGVNMSSFVLFSLALITVCVASESCNNDGYQKVACFKRDNQLFHKLLITDLDPTHAKWGKDVDWANFQDSLRSLACRCEAKARNKGLTYFAIGFYGECYAGKNDAAIEEKIANPSPTHVSTQCVSGAHAIEACNHKDKVECAGVADHEFVYKIVSNTVFKDT